MELVQQVLYSQKKDCSVWNIERQQQVNANETIEIASLNILGGYSAKGKSRTNIYSLYKRIMKHDPKAINEIESLEDAKEIIKMIIGNVYLNGELLKRKNYLIEDTLLRMKTNRRYYK